MRKLLVTLALVFACNSIASACDCKPDEKKIEAFKVEIEKQKANKFSRYSKCIRQGGTKESCQAEVRFYMNQ